MNHIDIPAGRVMVGDILTEQRMSRVESVKYWQSPDGIPLVTLDDIYAHGGWTYRSDAIVTVLR